MSLDEFAIISKYFDRHVKQSAVIKGIGDDCAILAPPAHEEILLTLDTMNCGVHFLKDIDPFDLGYKALAVSLSDVAAMGGVPRWFLLALTIPEAKSSWLQKFADGLFSLASRYHLSLIGGDTTKGPLAVTTQVIGTAPKAQSIRRQGAKPGDDIYVTGLLGVAGFGLYLLQNKLHTQNDSAAQFLVRFNRPEPRVELGLKLRGIATAAIDISDGLLADLNHILSDSQVGASIQLEKIPIAELIQQHFGMPQAAEFCVSHGDDYELCFTAPQTFRESIQKLSSLEIPVTRIGTIDAQSGLRISFQDKPIKIDKIGYQHFR